MGGWNSGRRSARGTVEGCASIVLSINTIMRAAGGRSPVRLRVVASVNGHSQEILARLDLDPEAGTGTLALTYDVQHVSTGTGPQHDTVPLVPTPCRFGGRRWWAVCPATGRRAVNLYLPNGGRRFLSRVAYRLAYQSQRETAAGRAWRTIRRVDARLGHDDERDRIQKPRWMRWHTFNRLCDRREAAEAVVDDAFIATGERMLRRWGR